MVNSPAGITTICGQSAQSLNAATAPGTFQMTGGAAKRSSGDRAASRVRADATSAAVSALSAAIRASNAGPLGEEAPLTCACAATGIIAPAIIPQIPAVHEGRRP